MMQKLGGIIIVLFVAFYAITIYGTKHNCDRRGGVLVLGLGWFECVKEAAK